MTIHLPPDLERFVHDQVLAGRYPSEDDVIRDALEQLRRHTPPLTPSLGSIGAMHDDAELLEQVTQDITARPSRNPRSGWALLLRIDWGLRFPIDSKGAAMKSFLQRFKPDRVGEPSFRPISIYTQTTFIFFSRSCCRWRQLPRSR